jgi:hypothetical protein
MKKTVGIILIVIGSLLSLVVLLSIPNFLGTILSLLDSANAFSLGVAFGELAAFITLVAVTFLCIWLGLKWCKK